MAWEGCLWFFYATFLDLFILILKQAGRFQLNFQEHAPNKLYNSFGSGTLVPHESGEAEASLPNYSRYFVYVPKHRKHISFDFQFKLCLLCHKNNNNRNEMSEQKQQQFDSILTGLTNSIGKVSVITVINFL